MHQTTEILHGTGLQRQLDAEVATRIMGFRWVEWNEAALRGAPLYEPGRFLARADDLTAHLHVPAAEHRPRHADPLARVPRYSGREEDAFRVATTAGLFASGKALLYRELDGTWVIEVRGSRVASACLPELLCRASLRWLEAEGGKGA